MLSIQTPEALIKGQVKADLSQKKRRSRGFSPQKLDCHLNWIVQDLKLIASIPILTPMSGEFLKKERNSQASIKTSGIKV
jgi:hypothetical protein